MSGPTPTFQGEVMLAGWTETHNGGAKVTLWLPDPSDLDAFRALTVKKGNTAGHRFMAVLVEIGEDEKPVLLDANRLKTEILAHVGPTEAFVALLRGGELAKLAGMLCDSEDFQAWLFEQHPDVIATDHPAIDAADIVRRVCGITSRAELDHNTEAAEVFHRRFRKPWLEFSK